VTLRALSLTFAEIGRMGCVGGDDLEPGVARSGGVSTAGRHGRTSVQRGQMVQCVLDELDCKDGREVATR
jgi:hypothetical protein